MFLCFVDWDNPKHLKEAQSAKRVMNELSEKYGDYLGFFMANNTQYWRRKRILGITWDDLPSMAFNMVDQKVLPYPRGMSIDKETMMSWMDDVFKGNI